MFLHFWNLSKNTYFQMSRRFWDLVLSLKKGLGLDWKGLEKVANFKYGRIRKYEREKQMMPLENLLKLEALLFSHFNITDKFIEGEIEKIRSGRNGKIITSPKLPVDLLDPRWAAIVDTL